MPRKPKDPIPPAIRWSVWERDDFTCHYCGRRKHLAVDHKVPESRGGLLEPTNLLTACARCNSRKGAKSYESFIAEIEAFSITRDIVSLRERVDSGQLRSYRKRVGELTSDEARMHLYRMERRPKPRAGEHAKYLLSVHGRDLACALDFLSPQIEVFARSYLIPRINRAGLMHWKYAQLSELPIGDWETVMRISKSKARVAPERFRELSRLAFEKYGEEIQMRLEFDLPGIPSTV